MYKKIVCMAALLLLLISLMGSQCYRKNPPPKHPVDIYPGVLGDYQYAGYIFFAGENGLLDVSPEWSGIKPEEIFDSEYSESEQQEIYDCITNGLEYLGKVVVLGFNKLASKSFNWEYGYFATREYRYYFTEKGFKIEPTRVSDVSFIEKWPTGMQKKAEIKYDSEKENLPRYLMYYYFILGDLNIELALIYECLR